jgi:hypothetical protein
VTFSFCKCCAYHDPDTGFLIGPRFDCFEHERPNRVQCTMRAGL